VLKVESLDFAMLDFLNDSMYKVMLALMYARIRSYIEHCMLHDFYIYGLYYGLFHSLFPCMHQSKEIIANFSKLFVKRQTIHKTKYSSMHVCMLIIQEIEYRMIPF